MTLFAMLTLAAAVGPIAWLVRTRIAGSRQWLVAGAAAVAVSSSALLAGPWALLSVYAVLQGGNSVTTNPFHHWFPSDRFGLDLVKLNRLGNRARGQTTGGLRQGDPERVAPHPQEGVGRRFQRRQGR